MTADPQLEIDFAAPSVGKQHRRAGDTEAGAAQAVFPRTGTQRELVLMCIAASATGHTAEEIEGTLGMNGNTVRPRLVELREAGWVEDSGDRRPTWSGQDAIVWCVTHKTRRHMQEAL